MHIYLHKVQEKYFKYLFINFSEKPQGRILISCFHIFRKSREEITRVPKSKFHSASDKILSSATVYYTYFITGVINGQQNTEHPSRVYWRPNQTLGHTHLERRNLSEFRCTAYELLVQVLGYRLKCSYLPTNQLVDAKSYCMIVINLSVHHVLSFVRNVTHGSESVNSSFLL